ncbi:MAG: substrate-binding domain-containing protein [Sedimentisphaerales bacterium]
MSELAVATDVRWAKKAGYTKIAEILRSQRKEIVQATRLVPEVELAQQHGVARTTVRRAMGLLEKEGSVVRRRGHGTFLQPSSTRPVSAVGSVIGFVCPWWVESITSWYAARVFDGIASWADNKNCHINILRLGRFGEGSDELLEKIASRNLRGLVWVHPVPEQIDTLLKVSGQIPCVVVGREYKQEGIYTVVPDYDQAAKLVDNCLLSNGHKKYAVLARNLADPYAAAWFEGVKKSYKQRGAVFDAHELFLDITPFDRIRLAELVQSFYLAVHPDVTALLVTSSSYLIPLFSDEQFRSKVGDSISVMAFDYGVQAVNTYLPGLQVSHIACDWTQLGSRAMDMLFSLLEGQTVPKVVREPVKYVEGQTVKDIRK